MVSMNWMMEGSLEWCCVKSCLIRVSCLDVRTIHPWRNSQSLRLANARFLLPLLLMETFVVTTDRTNDTDGQPEVHKHVVRCRGRRSTQANSCSGLGRAPLTRRKTDKDNEDEVKDPMYQSARFMAVHREPVIKQPIRITRTKSNSICKSARFMAVYRKPEGQRIELKRC